MNEDIRKKLTARFPPEIEKTKPGKGESGDLTYIPGEAVIERLGEALGSGGWGWKIIDIKINDGAVMVQGELTALGKTYSGCDCHPLFVDDKDSPQRASDAIGNAIKSADTGALVRAARLLEVGLYLWFGGKPTAKELDGKPAYARKMSAGQRDAIRTSARRLGWSDQGIASGANNQYGVQPDALTMEQANDYRRRIAIERAKITRRDLGWTQEQFVDALGGKAPSDIDIVELEEFLHGLEEKAKETK